MQIYRQLAKNRKPLPLGSGPESDFRRSKSPMFSQNTTTAVKTTKTMHDTPQKTVRKRTVSVVGSAFSAS